MSHGFYCTRCKQWMEVDVECPSCETEFELKENEMNESTNGGQGMTLESFNENPKCPKCLTMSPALKHMELSDKRAYLEVTCEECGYSWNMETADAGKKKVILECKDEMKADEIELVQGKALDQQGGSPKAKEDDETKLAPPDKSYEETEEGMKEIK